MKQSVKWILLIVLLVVLILAAFFGYRYLTSRYDAADASENADESEIIAAPDFTVTDADGNEVHLSDYLGKPVVVNFWATWCGPCQSEFPAFANAYETYGEDVTFMMVNLTDGYRDTVSSAQAFVTENGYDFPVYFDTKYDASYVYNVSSIPLTVLIDADGNIYKAHIGAMSEKTLNEYIDALLNGGE
jgi:thiol-disulfide isomerase/thioredoxin